MQRAIGSSILLTFLAVFAVACGSSGDGGGGDASSTSGGGDATTVKVGYTTGLLAFAPVLIGEEKGFYEEQGLKLENVQFASGGDVTTAILSGDIDVGATGLDRPVQLLATGKPPVQGIAGLKVTPAFILMAQPDLDIPSGDVRATMQALKGKRIGIAGLGGSADASLTALLAAAGMTKNDVIPVEVGLGPSALAAMRQKTIDANLVVEPDLSTIEAQRLGKTVLDMREAGDVGDALSKVPTSGLLAEPGWVRDNPETVRKLIAGTNRANEWIQANKQDAVQLIAREFGIEPEIADKIFDKEIATLSTEISEDRYNSLTEELTAAGLIERKPTYDEAIATQFSADWR